MSTLTDAELHSPAAHIGGETLSADARIDVVDPFTGTAFGTTGEAGAEAVDQAVAAARQALPAWSSKPVAERAAVLLRAADAIQRRGPEIAGLVTREMGMPTALALATQQALPAAVLRASAAAAQQFPWTEPIDGGLLRRSAAGVVGAITPWNMPTHQIVAKVSATLAAGCTVVLKPSEATPFDAAVVRECFLDAGLDAAAFNIVNGTGPVTGQALASHSGLAHVSFTGSVRGGRAVATAAAQTLTRTTLELGGKSPAVVAPDADLAAVIPRVVASGLVNSGQACNATTRLVLPHAHANQIEELLAQAVSELVVGDPTAASTTHGPLASAAHTQRVLAHIARAHADGARVIAGSGRALEIGTSNCFVAPVIFGDLGTDSTAVREEIFGPVLVVQYYRDVAEAIDLANDCDYGLSAEVWSTSGDLAADIAGQLDVGQVKVNGVRTRERPAVPFGGIKNSGYGRELGSAGIAEFTEIKAVMS